MGKNQKNIVVTGSLAYDNVMNFPGYFKDHIMPDKIHILNLSFLTDKLRRNYGGTAANIAYNLALLGCRPVILAAAGKDSLPICRFLKKAGVDVSQISLYRKSLTSNYFAIVDKADNQLGGFYSGAMEHSTDLSLATIQPIGLVIISPSLPAAMVKFCRECHHRRLPYLFDPGMQLPRFSQAELLSAIKSATILIGNDYEVSLMLKKLGATIKQLLKQVKILITTFAGRGSLVETGSKKLRIPAAKPAQVVDPVGAGDAYRAGFVAGYLRGLDLKTCGRMGALAAVYTVEKEGTTTHRFTLTSFRDRYKQEFGENLSLLI